MPICTIAGTPTAAAAATAAPTSGSCRSRCVWLSGTGTRRGAGGGGSSASNSRFSCLFSLVISAQAPRSSRSSSSATIDSSSFLKIGVGGCNGVPTAIGVDAQVAPIDV
jgi:hypothetical protein